MLPDKHKPIIGTIVTLVVVVLALMMEWRDFGSDFTRWTSRAFAILVAISNVLGLRITAPAVKRKFPPVLPALLVALLFLLPACRNPNAAAWRTADAVLKARDLTAQQLAWMARTKHQECRDRHKAKTPEFAKCIEPYRKALQEWQRVGRPAINSAVQVTATALQIAEKAEGKKKIDWMALLKPAACALLRVAKAWGHLWPDRGAALLGALGGLGEVTCD